MTAASARDNLMTIGETRSGLVVRETRCQSALSHASAGRPFCYDTRWTRELGRGFTCAFQVLSRDSSPHCQSSVRLAGERGRSRRLGRILGRPLTANRIWLQGLDRQAPTNPSRRRPCGGCVPARAGSGVIRASARARPRARLAIASAPHRNRAAGSSARGRRAS
jgi:hypothetical protein